MNDYDSLKLHQLFLQAWNEREVFQAIGLFQWWWIKYFAITHITGLDNKKQLNPDDVLPKSYNLNNTLIMRTKCKSFIKSFVNLHLKCTGK